MWQRFTERARKVVFYAQEEAQKLGEGYVSTEHLLLGLLREDDSVSARVLKKLGVSAQSIRHEVENQLPKGEARQSYDMSLTPRAKRVIDLAYDEARNLNNNYIGTEHLLLGLIREGEGLAGRVLEQLDVHLEPCRRIVIEMQDEDSGSVFERGFEFMLDYSVLAARAISAAEKEAATFGLEGKALPGHLLMVLTADESCAASQVLALMKVSPKDVFAQTRARMPNREAMPRRPVRTDMFNDVLSAAAEFAGQLHCEGVSTEHILLALVGCDDPVTTAVLRDRSKLTVKQTLAAVKSFYKTD